MIRQMVILQINVSIRASVYLFYISEHGAVAFCHVCICAHVRVCMCEE